MPVPLDVVARLPLAPVPAALAVAVRRRALILTSGPPPRTDSTPAPPHMRNGRAGWTG